MNKYFFKKNKGFIQHDFGQDQNNAGFTIMELLVVLLIMGTLFSFVLVNIGGKKGVRNLKLAQSQLVSDIRKIQSYTLSSRSIPGGQPTQYYLLKFDMRYPDRYFIQAIFDKDTAPGGNGKLITVETIPLPQGVKFDLSSVPWVVNRPDNPPPNISLNSTECGLLAFKAPFAKTYMAKGCSPNPATEPYVILGTDDYSQIVNFNGEDNTSSKNSTLVITLREGQTNQTRTITVQASNGLVTFSP